MSFLLSSTERGAGGPRVFSPLVSVRPEDGHSPAHRLRPAGRPQVPPPPVTTETGKRDPTTCPYSHCRAKGNVDRSERRTGRVDTRVRVNGGRPRLRSVGVGRTHSWASTRPGAGTKRGPADGGGAGDLGSTGREEGCPPYRYKALRVKSS